MSTTTSKYGLVKPALTDVPDITAMNPNWDTIDSQLAAAVKKDGSVPMDGLTIGTRKTGSTVGVNSFASGTNNLATAPNSHAEGSTNTASGDQSHAEGLGAVAEGISAHAEGTDCYAKGARAHAEGVSTKAIGDQSHAEGNKCSAINHSTHAEGVYSLASPGILYSIISFNNTNKTITLNSVLELAVKDKIDIRIASDVSITDITITDINGLVVSLSTSETINSSWTYAIKRNKDGYPSHAEGLGTIATGLASHAEGAETRASGSWSHAEGNATTAIGYMSHAEGYLTTANNDQAHAEGNASQATGAQSHAEGYLTIASGLRSHAEGNSSTASGQYSHAGGTYGLSLGIASFAHGSGVTAQGDNQSVFGRFNSTSTTDLFQVGRGTSDSDRANAFIVKSDGDIASNLIKGAMTMGSNVNINNAALVRKKNSLVEIRLNAVMASGNMPIATTIATIPADFRPLSVVTVNAHCYSAANAVYPCMVDINTDGTIKISIANTGTTLPYINVNATYYI